MSELAQGASDGDQGRMGGRGFDSGGRALDSAGRAIDSRLDSGVVDAGESGRLSSGATRGSGSAPRGDEPRFGPYLLKRALARGRLGERWVAIHEREHTTHVVHRVALHADKHARRRFLTAVQPIAELSHPHLLAIEQYSLQPGGGACIVTTYTGNADGLVTLPLLMHLKGGRLSDFECRRAALHVLSAIGHAHERGIRHGTLSADDVLVDRHGRVLLELYGLPARFEWSGAPTEADRRSEVRCAIHLVCRALLGSNVLMEETTGRPDADCGRETGWKPQGVFPEASANSGSSALAQPWYRTSGSEGELERTFAEALAVVGADARWLAFLSKGFAGEFGKAEDAMRLVPSSAARDSGTGLAQIPVLGPVLGPILSPVFAPVMGWITRSTRGER